MWDQEAAHSSHTGRSLNKLAHNKILERERDLRVGMLVEHGEAARAGRGSPVVDAGIICRRISALEINAALRGKFDSRRRLGSEGVDPVRVNELGLTSGLQTQASVLGRLHRFLRPRRRLSFLHGLVNAEVTGIAGHRRCPHGTSHFSATSPTPTK